MPDSSPHPLSQYQLWRLVKNFRLQTLLFGALWLFFGMLYFFIGADILICNETDSLKGQIVGVVGGSVLVLVGSGWMFAGVNTFRRRLWALYLGLICSYLFVLLDFSLFFVGVNDRSIKNFLFFALMLAQIVQTHRLIGWSLQLQQMGIPLTIRPAMIYTRHRDAVRGDDAR